MKIHPRDFRVPPRRKVNLERWPTRIKDIYDTKEEYAQKLTAHVAQLSDCQELLYACDKYAVLLIFIFAAVITPDGNPVTQVMVGGPMVVLYILGIAAAWLFGKSKKSDPAD